MALYLFNAFLIITAFICLFVALKAILSSGWFLKWLQGSFGMIALAGAICLSLLVYDLFGYSKGMEGEVVATLTFNQLAEQEFNAELVDEKGERHTFRLNGDQWQLDARLIYVSSMMGGQLPSYKLDRISGRFLSLEQEKNDKRTIYSFDESDSFDTWLWLESHSWLPFISARYGSAAYMPMKDRAIFVVKTTPNGLLPVAVNDSAKTALDSW